MQFAHPTPGTGAFPPPLPPPQGDGTDIEDQLRRQRAYHRRIIRRRAVELWWLPAMLIAVGGLAAGVAGPLALSYPIYILAAGASLVILVLMALRVEFGLLLVAVTSTALFPQLLAAKALSIYPALPLLLWLFAVLLVQTALRQREPVLPSLRAIWPLLGLLCLAFVSNIMIQLTWSYGVAHRIGGSPILFDETYGIALFCLPLVTVAATSAALTGRERWIEYMQTAFLAIAVFLSVVIIVQFKRIDASIYTFRFSDPKLAWMSLKAISQILVLGAIIGYARTLCTAGFRLRALYGVSTLLCLVGVYFCLQNSWWVEAAVALAAMTLAYSRRLFFGLCLACLPLLPLVKAEIDKLSAVKSADFYRLIIWQDALRVWSKSPLLGVGPGNFWAYDTVFTHLPLYLRNFAKTGLGVAHNGYLQVLGELGVGGLFFYLAFMVVMAFICLRLVLRSSSAGQLPDRVLGLVGLGLVCGSALGDFTSGAMFLQPRQLGSSGSLTQVLSTWIIFGCVMYKDQVWRKARQAAASAALRRGHTLSRKGGTIS
jgi:O-antigen ligase